MAYLYRHIRLDINQPFYIGVGSKDDNFERAYESRKGRRHPKWLDVVNLTKYKVEILMDEIEINEAYKKETEFIKLHGRKDLGTGHLVNVTDGGLGCVNGITRETREKMAAKLRGRPLPQWQVENMRIASKGREVTWTRKPIFQIDSNGNIIMEFQSIREASKKLNAQEANIGKVLRGERVHTTGLFFKYKN